MVLFLSFLPALLCLPYRFHSSPLPTFCCSLLFPSFFLFLSPSSALQGKIVAQGRLLLQDTFMVSDPEGGGGRMRERRVFLFEQIVIFSEPLDKKRGFSMPGFLYKNSIKVSSIDPMEMPISFQATTQFLSFSFPSYFFFCVFLHRKAM